MPQHYSDLPAGHRRILNDPGYSDLPPGAVRIVGGEPPSMLERAGQFIAEEGPVIAGAAVGGFAGIPAGPAGIIGGGMLGAAAGESLKQLSRHAVGGGRAPQTSAESLEKISEAIVSGGLQEAGGALVPKAAVGTAKILGKSAQKNWERVLAATKEVNKAKAEKVIPGLIDRRVIAASREGLEKRLAAETAKAGKAVRKTQAALIATEKAGKAADIDSVALLKSLETYREKMLVPGTGSAIVGNEAGLSAIDSQIAKLGELVTAQGRYISKESSIGLRRILDRQVVKSNKAAYLGEDIAAKAEAQREFANALRRELAAKEPDFAKVNAEFSFWKPALDVIKATNRRKVSQTGIVGRVLGAGGAGGLGGTAAYALTGSGQQAAGTLVVLAALNKAMQTTAWRTTSAVVKNAIADALASGNTQAALKLIGQVGGVTASQLRERRFQELRHPPP